MVYVTSALLYMVLIRLLSGSLEVTVAGLMYKTHDLEKALALNSMLALVGPCVLIITTGLGVAGLGDKISFQKMICIFSGVLLILLSLKMK
ncbi:YqhV family protein [Lysinibacillus sp. SGAir0095]|uniref:YqhV family protein n=1 Tax=Lysinibacillus sp. SGAir0095 TaxID=2070463 RepID=UPI001F0E3C9C|nr:YqhV family protein [Lysinibacillus sp. SGAir0095]